MASRCVGSTSLDYLEQRIITCWLWHLMLLCMMCCLRAERDGRPVLCSHRHRDFLLVSARYGSSLTSFGAALHPHAAATAAYCHCLCLTCCCCPQNEMEHLCFCSHRHRDFLFTTAAARQALEQPSTAVGTCQQGCCLCFMYVVCAQSEMEDLCFAVTDTATFCSLRQQLDKLWSSPPPLCNLLLTNAASTCCAVVAAQSEMEDLCFAVTDTATFCSLRQQLDKLWSSPPPTRNLLLTTAASP
jgi:hypothetical protein